MGRHAMSTTGVICRSHENQPDSPVRLFPGTCVQCGPDKPIRTYGLVRQCGACGWHWTVTWERGAGPV